MVVGVIAMDSTAGAVEPGDHNRTIVRDTPASWTPHALDGTVNAFAEIGDKVVVGGNFSQIRAVNDPTPINKPYIFVFERNTGTITSFNTSLNGDVTSLVPSGDGETVFVGGGFNNVNGQTVRSVVKININTGQRVSTFNPPAFNGRVHDLQLRNGVLYVSGRFTTVANQPHTLFAALNPVTGQLDPTVKVDFADPRRNGALSILSSDITPDGTKMVAIGNFTKANGATRYQIAQIDLTTTPPTVANWSTNQYGDGCSNSFQSYMRDVEYSRDGSFFVVGTTGAYNTTYLCDTAARWETAATGSNLMPTWVNYTGGDTLLTVAVGDSIAYLGGHQRWANNPYAGDRVGAGATERPGLSAVDVRSGATVSWNPGRTRGVGVSGFLLSDTGLWIGSDTDRISNYTYKGRLAFMPVAGGVKLPTEFTGTLPGKTVSVDGSVEQVCVRPGLFGIGCREWADVTTEKVTNRDFTGTSVTASSTQDSTTDWHNNRGAFMIDGVLYTGWADGTFKKQTFDGSSFGPLTNIPLALIPGESASLSRFSTEDLATITGMFYDPASGNLFFTRSGSNVLSYRSFSPESNIVGAQRIDSANGAAGVTWSGVRSMFIADGFLYTGDANGNLYRRTWDSTSKLPTGAATLVSGPSKDGQNWSAKDTFVYAAEGWEAPNTPPVAAASASCQDGTCIFDGSTSSDDDGSIDSYVWDFGDGSAPGNGVFANHVYMASGTYHVTLTVTDDRGATDSTELTVEITVPNVGPVAAFTTACDGLECSFDASDSADPDGTIVSYEWDLGDGTTKTGAQISHQYADSGSYTATLTVTDDEGATNSRSTTVGVVDPDAVGTVDFGTVTSTDVNWNQANLTIPQIKNGSTLLLFATMALPGPTVTGPSGWTLVDSGSNATTDTQSYLWTRTAGAADSGSAVTITTSGTVKISAQIVSYEGADRISAHALEFDTVSHAERTTPVLPVTAPGSRIVSYWADKTSATTTWALPAGVTERVQSSGSGGGRITAAIADSGPLAVGSAGGFTAVANSASRRGVTWSVVLAPKSDAPNVAPTAAFTQNCTNLTCTFDASGSNDIDGSIVSYDWDFGDGQTASGQSTSHTFGSAGSYDVTLTVTDDDGASGQTMSSVTVAVTTTTPVFRGATEFDGNVLTASPAIPASVQPGDTLVLITTLNNNGTTVTGPSGWTALGGQNNSATGLQSFAWTRTATADDAGKTAPVTLSAYSKISVEILAYGNSSGVTASAVSFDTVNHAERTTPMVAVADAGSTLISYWADKNGGPGGWTVPATVSQRASTVGSGGGLVTATAADTGSLAPGTAGGFTATAALATRRGVVWSIVVAPA